MVEKGVRGGEDHVVGAVVFFFEQAACTVLNEDLAKGVGALRTIEVDAKASGGRLS